MWAICKKELRQFFSSLTGYIAIIVFLLLNGLFLFVFPDSNLFDSGYATLDTFFEMAPWVLLLLIPAITMRSFSEEFKGGTFEILQTKPLTHGQVILGKYIASLVIVLIGILPTLIYVYTISSLSTGGIDMGGIAGSYLGLVPSCRSFYGDRHLLQQFYTECRGGLPVKCLCLFCRIQRLFRHQQDTCF